MIIMIIIIMKNVKMVMTIAMTLLNHDLLHFYHNVLITF